MSVFTWVPTQSSKQNIKATVLKAQFGDGYEQRIGDGLNVLPRTWTVSFADIDVVIEAIEVFLKTHKGTTAFTWVPPFGGSGKFVCDSWDRGLDSPHVHNLSATFREVFEP